MHGTAEFAAFLSLYAAVKESPLLTPAERADVLAVAREQFLQRAHEPRLAAIVTRLTEPQHDDGKRTPGAKRKA